MLGAIPLVLRPDTVKVTKRDDKVVAFIIIKNVSSSTSHKKLCLSVFTSVREFMSQPLPNDFPHIM